MTPEHWRQIEELFHSAREHGPSVLNGVDPELRREVERLLSQDRAPIGIGSELGPYRIEGILGAGGMGQVFRAMDHRLGRPVAVKISSAAFSGRFEREARAIASLSHPNICTLYDVGTNFLVMELIEGETLAASLKRGALPLARTIEYGREIAGALAAAHAQGIVHRDLKPANIMLGKSGLKVLDFGLAKSLADETQTMSFAVMGTPAYMAPEQREGHTCDTRTDLYALGLVLSEMATGKRTLPGERPALDKLPERLAHVIGRCLAPDPEQRWQSARDVEAELAWAAAPAAPSKPRPAGELARLWPIAAALAILAAALWVAVPLRRGGSPKAVLNAAILPPPKSHFDFAASLGLPALSPDGRNLVFAAIGEDGHSQLWLRPLDSAQARPLEDTASAAFPFWSPDSRWVGFFADGMLKKIDTRGGQPIPLAETHGARGGTWSAKNVIVFAPNIFAPLLKISAEGGKTSNALERPEVLGTAYGLPWFLPDGEHFLFVTWSGAGRMNLRVASIGSSATKAIGETDSNAVYSGGFLLYMRERSLLAQPFDLKSLRATGEAAPIAENVQRFFDLISAGAFSVSSTGLLAYQSGQSTSLRQLTWFDRQGTPEGAIGEPRAFFDIELSPDGQSLAASAPDEVGNYDLWIYDLTRGLPARFTFDPGGEYWAVWSQDGKNVIFNSTRKGHYDLYRKAAGGGGSEELLYADAEGKVPTSWSPDGKSLLYFTGGGERYEMWLLPLTPQHPRAALHGVKLHPTRFNELSPRFSPDGRWVAYTCDETGSRQVYIAPFGQIAEKRQISLGGGGNPRWRRDGKAIFYQSYDGQVMEVELRASGENLDAGAARKVFASVSSAGGYSYDVSGDGQRALEAIPAGGRKTSEPVTLIENWAAAVSH